MSDAKATGWAPQDMLDSIRALAGAKDHRLPDKQTGIRPLTLVSAQAILRYLEGRPFAAHAQADQGARTVQPPAARSASPSKASPKVTRPGIFCLDKDGGLRVYKVILSQYSGHLQARLFIPPAQPGERGTWRYAKGMMGVLREDDRMTPEQSRRYEEMYGYPVCTRCGAPLENDESRERRYGPVCWDKEQAGE